MSKLKPRLPEISGQEKLKNLKVHTKIVRNGNYVYPILATNTGQEDCYTETLHLVMEGIRDTYFNQCYNCTVSNTVFEKESPTSVERITSIRRSITRAINRLGRLISFTKESPVEFHMSSTKYSAHLTLVDERSKNNGVVMHMYLADDMSGIIMSGIANIMPDGNVYGLGDGALLMYAGMTLFFLGKRYKMAEAAAEAHQDVCKFGIMGSFELYLTEYMLYKLIDCVKSSNANTNYRYLPIEMFMFSTILKDMNANIEVHTLASWKHQDYISNYDTRPSRAPKEIFPDTNPICPEIDFDDKEWKFIANYCKRNDLFTDKKINIIPYFTNQRYGNTFKMDIQTDKGITDKLVFTFTIDVDAKILQVYISETINPHTAVITIADFHNIDNFDLSDSLRALDKCVMYTGFNTMFASVGDLTDKSPLLQSGIENTSLLILDILRLYAVLHDRPERSRMVKGVRHSSIPSKRKSPNVEKTEVVWRILKTASAAKEYVKFMSTDSSRNMEYTLEEWERVGHYRTLKSGKQIWIEPTTCRRREDLIKKDKEIKIKL